MKKILFAVIAALLCMVTAVFTASAALIGDDSGFYYDLSNNNTASLEEYHGNARDIVIPGSVYSSTVVSIADNTFSKNKTIRSVVIPDSVEDIGSYAFYGCTALEKVKLPQSVTQIKAATFYGCDKLEEITIPASVTTIAANAFSGCDDLTIYGTGGSFAQTYANDHGIAFVDTRVFGDVDLDSTVTSSDALSVLRMSVGMDEYGEEALALADIDSDYQLTSSDALELLRYSVGMTADERIGQKVW